VYDAYPLMGQWSDELDGYLRALAGAADLITVAAEAMAGILPEPARGKVRFLPNGADVESFIEAEDAPCPADLAAIPRPRIGYAGGLNRKVDYPAIAEVARRRPDWHLVLIGGAEDANVMADPDLADAFAACRSLANVHFLGLRPRAEIAAFARHMDVNVMIYRSDGSGWYRYIYPLKLHEYLAAGRPVVSSPLDSVRPFRAVVDLADTPDAWLAAIERALAGGVGTPDRRRAVALENTWDKRVDLLEGWLTGLAAR
jgi:glycosyltransferase involved in cell wall biosynthesis